MKGSRQGPVSLAQLIPDWPTLKPPDRNKKKKVARPSLSARELNKSNKLPVENYILHICILLIFFNQMHVRHLLKFNLIVGFILSLVPKALNA